MSWFENLVGFPEENPDRVRANLAIVDQTFLQSKVTGATFRCGHLDTPSLEELRARTARLQKTSGTPISVAEVVGDVQKLHQAQENNGALFQVASQFNLLEMVGPQVTPERGVGIYETDRTQGPACAIACGAATIFRNYFVEVDDGQVGQSADKQIDCLRDLGVALERSVASVSEKERVTLGVALVRSLIEQIDKSIEKTDGLPERPTESAEILTALLGHRPDGMRPVALNVANGVNPGEGFLSGALAQEEVLCRSSTLHRALVDDPMYEAHRKRQYPDSTAWTIYSPDVPIFRKDDGAELAKPWLLSFITCIHRVLSTARAFRHSSIVLGAWDCGAFHNDPHRTASDFRQALPNEFAGAFSDVVFAITDWSQQRRFLGPFRDV